MQRVWHIRRPAVGWRAGMTKRPCRQPCCPALVDRGYCDKHRTRQRYCMQPGCNQIITDGSWCQAHHPDKLHDDRRGSAASRGYGQGWPQVRMAYLLAWPLCGRCQQRGRTRAADMVHHIVAIRDGGARLDNDNLLSLCWHCHGKVGPQGDSVAVVMSYKQAYQSA